MKFRRLLIVPSIAALVLTQTACGLLSAQSKPQTAGERPAADLMVKPGEFSRPPVTATANGETALTGADALPWALDTLDLGGDIRAKLIRLQDWVRILLDEDRQ